MAGKKTKKKKATEKKRATSHRVHCGAVPRARSSSRRSSSGRVDVRCFGAVGDGVTDDTAAVQAALESVRYGGCLDLSNVLCSVTGVDLNGFRNLHIRACGGGFVFPAGARNRPFVLRNGDGLVLGGVLFQCHETQKNRAVNCCDLMNVDNATVSACTFRGATFYGLGVYQDTFTPLDGTCKNLLVEGCLFEGIGTIGLEPFPKKTGGSLTIRNNVFRDCGNAKVGKGNAGAFKCGQGFEHTVVEHNTITNCGASPLGNGVGIVGWGDMVFSHNHFIGNEIAVAISTGVHSLGDKASFASLIIEGNQIDAAVVGIKVTHLAASPYGKNHEKLTITGNTLRNRADSKGIGIEVRGDGVIQGLSVTDNTFHDIGTVPVLLRDADGGRSSRPIVSRNTFIATRRACRRGGTPDTTRTAPDLALHGAESPFVADNVHFNSGEYAILLDDATGMAIVSDNKFIDGNVTGRAAIGIVGSSNCEYHVCGNSMIGGAWQALCLGLKSGDVITYANNVAPRIATTSAPTIESMDMLGKKVASSDAAITGYITIRDANGTERKIALIS